MSFKNVKITQHFLECTNHMCVELSGLRITDQLHLNYILINEDFRVILCAHTHVECIMYTYTELYFKLFIHRQ